MYENLESFFNKQEQIKTSSKKGTACLVLVIIFGLLYGAATFFGFVKLSQIERAQEKMQQDISEQEAVQKQLVEVVSPKVEKVYIFDLERTLRGLRIEQLNQEFEAKINILNDEVSTAQNKISSLKETKEKDDFSEVYMKSLKFKRDTMIQAYNRTIEHLTEDINRIIAEVAKEKGASVVFDKRVIASQNENVEDLTDEVVKRIQLKRPQILDE